MDAAAVAMAFIGAFSIVAGAVTWFRPELCRWLGILLLARAHALEVQGKAMKVALREYGEDHGGVR